MNISLSLLLTCFWLLFTQCKTNNDNTSHIVVNEKNIASSHSKIEKIDSYFNGHNQIKSEKGPTTITRNVIEASEGTIWLATWEGIIQYNGKEFLNLTNEYDISRYRAFTLLEDRNKNIWIGTVGAGLFRFDGKDFTQFTMKEGLPSNTIGCLTEDANGSIWIGTLKGLSNYNENKFTNYYTPNGGNDDDMNSIIQNSDGSLWIGTRGKLFSFDGIKFTEVNKKDGTGFYNTRTLVKSKNGTNWIGGQSGLHSYTGNTFYHHSEKFVGYIYEDRGGNIWVSQSSPDSNINNMSLIKHQTTQLPNRTTQSEIILNEEGQIFGIIEDSSRNIWFGTEKGICKYNHEVFDCFR